MIPKVIHQVWKTNVVPDAWRAHVLSWRRRHPDWRFVLWTDDDCRRIVHDDFHYFVPVYDAYPYDIERADVIRYLILLRLGGVYVDLDLECLRPIDDLLAGERAVVASELPVHAGHFGRTELASNAFMAAAPGHPLFLEILHRLCRSDPRTTYHTEVLAKTGPLMLTDRLDGHRDSGVTVLEPHVFNPLANGSSELRCLRHGGAKAAAIRRQALERGAYGIHWFANSWIRTLAGPLVNPTPHAIPGWRFYPRLDSLYGDLGNGGRDIPRLAALADGDERAVGFNTDGFIKWRIRPRWRWVRMGDAGPDEGLYVRETAATLDRLTFVLGRPLWSSAPRRPATASPSASRRRNAAVC